MARPKKNKAEAVITTVPALSLEKREHLALYGKDEPYVKPVSIDPGIKLSQYKGSNEVNRAIVVNKQKHIRIP